MAGHGDALLQRIGNRVVRVAGDDGIAVRWHGDTCLLVHALTPGEGSDTEELRGRPIVVKGARDSMSLAVGSAKAEQRVLIDTLVAEAEAALAQARGKAR